MERTKQKKREKRGVVVYLPSRSRAMRVHILNLRTYCSALFLLKPGCASSLRPKSFNTRACEAAPLRALSLSKSSFFVLAKALFCEKNVTPLDH
jgi:hypothetical protein